MMIKRQFIQSVQGKVKGRTILSMVMVVIVLVSLIFYPLISSAAFNKQINYQGKLTSASGVAVTDGTYNMEFNLYTVSSGGVAIWTESRTGSDKVTVTNGLFSIMLGSVTSLSGIDFNQPLYLSVNIGGTGTPAWDGEMTPRKVLGAVPSAVEAERLGGILPSQLLRSDIAASSAVTDNTLAAFTITQNGTGNIFDLFDAGTSVMTVKDGGNVGIGTTTPTSFKLEIAGSIGPSIDNTYDLGSATRRFANIYATTINGTVTGTITPTGFTAGSVAFAGSGGTLDQDNANFFWNNTSKRLGIGTTSPDQLFHIEVSTALTNTISYPQRISHISSGTPTTNFGVGVEYELENASGINKVVMTEDVVFSDAVNATEDASYTLKLMRAGVLTTAFRHAGDTAIIDVAGGTGLYINGSGFRFPSGRFFADSGTGNAFIKFTNTNGTSNSSTNYFEITNGGIGVMPILSASGADTNIDFKIAPKGTGNTLFTSGNVGIGGNNPEAKLTISGTSVSSISSQTNISAFTANGLRINASNATSSQDAITYQSGSSGGGAAIAFGRGSSWDTFMSFYTNSLSSTSAGSISEKMRISSEGNIGIGTISPSGLLTLGGNRSASAWGVIGINLQTAAATYTDSSTAASATVASNMVNTFGAPTLAASNTAVTYTNAATVYIAGGPAAGTNTTVSNSYALWINGQSFQSAMATLAGGLTTASSAIGGGANFSVVSGVGSGGTDTSAAQFAGSSAMTYRTGFYGSTSSVLAANNNYSALIVASAPLTTAATGTNAWANQVTINTLGTVSNGGGGFPTNTASLYIGGASTAGTNNYALYSLSGNNYFGGNVGIGTTTPTTFKLETAGSIGPSVDNTYDLGSSTRRFANIYATNINGTITGSITPTGFTAGSVAFAGSGGTLDQDNANFFWDNTNKRLGIGTVSPNSKLDIAGSGTMMQLLSTGSAGMNFSGVSGAVRDFAFMTSGTARWILRTDSTAESGSNIGSDFSIIGRADDGSQLGQYLFIKRSNGNVGIGITSPLGLLTLGGNRTASAWGNNGINFQTVPATYTDSSTLASTTVAFNNPNTIGIPTLAATNASVTYTNASTLYIAGAPVAGTNATITKSRALHVASGDAYFGGNVIIGASSLSNAYLNFWANSVISLISTTRSDGTQAGLFRTNGWGDYTVDRAFGVGYDLTGIGTAGAGKLLVSSRIGIQTTTPSTALSFGSAAAQKIMIEDSATDVVGRALTVSAGGTVVGTSVSDIAGGNLILQSGLGTGAGASNISFNTGTTLTTGTTLQTMSTKMTILGNGNVGIGTTTPAAALTIQGSTNPLIYALNSTGIQSNAAIRLQSTSGGYSGFQMTDGNAGNSWAVGHQWGATTNANLVFSYGTLASETTVAQISSTGGFVQTGSGTSSFVGNVGIGTTTPTTFKLETAGSIGPSVDNTYDLGSSTRRFANIYATNINGTITGSITPTGFTAGSVAFAGSGGTLAQDNANLFFDDTNNRLGIGTASPSYPLDVVGAINSQVTGTGGTSNTSFANFTAYNPANNFPRAQFLIGQTTTDTNVALDVSPLFTSTGVYKTSHLSISTNKNNLDAGVRQLYLTQTQTLATIQTLIAGNPSSSAAPIAIAPGGTTAMTLLTNGNVGIGTTTPNAKLESFGTTEQLRLSYDASNRFSTTVGSTGSTTFDLAGTAPIFTFNKAVTIAVGGTALNVSNGNASFGNAVTVGGSFNRTGNITGVYNGGSGMGFNLSSANYTDSSSAASSTNANVQYALIGQMTTTPTNTAVTYTNASSLYIVGAPIAGTNSTITNPLALNVAAGTSYFGGNVGIGTANPDTKLSISDGTDFIKFAPGISTSTSGAALTFRGVGSGSGYIDSAKSLTLTYNGPNNSGARPFTISHSGTPVLTITGGSDQTIGNVGIGTAAPTHTLTLGSTSTGLTAYNTVDQTTNYERARGYWSGNIYTIGTESGGTGTPRSLQLRTTNRAITISDAGSLTGFFNLSGGNGVNDISVIGLNGTYSGTSGVQNMLSLLPTITQSSTAGYRGLWVSAFESATGSGNKYLIDVGTNTTSNGGGTHTSKFSVDNAGAVIANTMTINAPGGTHAFTIQGNVDNGTAGSMRLINNATGTNTYNEIAFTTGSKSPNIVSFGQNFAGTPGLFRISASANGGYIGFHTAGSQRMIIDQGGNVLIGSGASDGYAAFKVTQGVNAITSGGARAAYITSTLTAGANNDTLVGLDIAPTFTNGAFTGVTNLAARINGELRLTATTTSILRFASTTGTLWGQITGNSAGLDINAQAGGFTFVAGNTVGMQMFASTRNLVLQNGGTFSDGGYGLDIQNVATNGYFRAGTNALVVNASGNVGIGTTTPNNKLQVTSTSAGALSYGLELINADTTNNTATGILFGTEALATGYRKGGIVFNRTGSFGVGDMYFLNNSTANSTNAAITDAVMTLKLGGNVGIGTNTPTGLLTLAGSRTAAAWGNNGINLQTTAATYTDSSTAASTTVTNNMVNSFGIPTLAATNASVTYTNASTVYIAGAPTAGTNATITNPYALRVASGASYFGGNININSTNGAYVGFNNFTTGQTVDFRFGDMNNRVAATYGSSMTISAYHGLIVQNNAGGGAMGPSLTALAVDPSKGALLAKGAVAQSGDIFQVQNSSSSVLFNVTAAGNVGIGATSPSSTLTVGGNPSVVSGQQIGAQYFPAFTSGVYAGQTIQAVASAATDSAGHIAGLTAQSGTANNASNYTATFSGGGGVSAIDAGLLFRGTGTITGAHGIYVSSPTFTNATPSPVTNVSGIFIGAQKSTSVTNAYGIYQNGASDINYFAGNVGIGTTTPTSGLQISNAQTAASAIARGVYINNTLTAAANNDILYGLDVQPTFSSGAFTGVQNIAARFGGNTAFKYGSANYLYFGSSSDNYQILSANRNPINGIFADTTRASSEIVLETTTTGSGILFKTNTAVNTQGTNRMYINASGNVGIGTISPSGLLTLSGNRSASAWGVNGINLQTDAATYTDSSTAASATVTNNMVNSFGIPTLAAINTAVTYTNASTLYIAGAPTAGTNATITNPLAFNVAAGNSYFGGNVGIGTMNPLYKLQIVDTENNSLSIVSSSTDSSGINISNTSPGGHSFSFFSTGSANGAGAGRFGVYDFTTNKTLLDVQGSNGNLSIIRDSVLGWSSDPNYASLSSDSGISRFSSGVLAIGNGAQGNTSGTLIAGKIGIDTTTTTYTLNVGSSSVPDIVARFQNSTGTCDINPTTSSLSCSSDMTLKKNIATLDGTQWSYKENVTNQDNTILDKVLSLTPVIYNWNKEHDTDQTHIGFIAQDVRNVFPDLVSEDKSTHLLSLNYTGFMPYTIKAIQEIDMKMKNIDDLQTPNNLRTSLMAWLGSATNGIQSIFSKKVTTEELCVGDSSDQVCLTKDQLRALLQNSVTPSHAAPPAHTPETESTPTPVVAPAALVNESPVNESPVAPAPEESSTSAVVVPPPVSESVAPTE